MDVENDHQPPCQRADSPLSVALRSRFCSYIERSATARSSGAAVEYFSSLVLEITEHTAVSSYAKLRDLLAPRRRGGLRLAIDDVGAGYASLKHVVELQPDIIKIDRSLVHRSADDRARRSAISAFVLLALELGAIVIAEGVERPDDLQAVQDLGVDAVQGYLLAKPSADRRKLARGPSGALSRWPGPRATTELDEP